MKQARESEKHMNVVPCTKPVCAAVVQLAESLLERAKSGEIQSLVVAFEERDGDSGYELAIAKGTRADKLIGATTRAAHGIVHHVIGT